jgi:hypothetical protein
MSPDENPNPFRYCTEPVAGIDLSLRSPALVVISPTTEPQFIVPWSACKAYYLTSRKSMTISTKNITGNLFGAWENDQERYETIAEWVIGVLKKENVKSVALEDYAYSKHSSITALAENMGILKYFLYKNNIAYDLYSPSSIKKCACGSGNGKKEDMRDAFYEDTAFDIQGVYHRKPTDSPKSPVNDIIDAYYLACSSRVATAVQAREYDQQPVQKKAKRKTK